MTQLINFLGIIITPAIFFGIVLASLKYGLYREAARLKRLQSQFGVVDIAVTFSPQTDQILQAAFRRRLQDLLECLIGDGWLFATVKMEVIRIAASYVGALKTVYAVQLDYDCPQVIFDNKSQNHFITSLYAVEIENDELVNCEGTVISNFSIYAARMDRIDILTILTPDVLLAIDDLNMGADIHIKKNYLYFVFNGEKNPFHLLTSCAKARLAIATPINANLRRWHQSSANADRIALLASETL